MRIEQCNLSGVTSFDSAFYSSKTIKEVIIRDNDYPEAPLLTNTNSMFYTCSNLSKVDVSGLNTSSVTDMAYVFADATSLKEVDLSNFDTSSVPTKSGLFAFCTSFDAIVLCNFVTFSVPTVFSMFYYIAITVDFIYFLSCAVTTCRLYIYV
ncbi:DUF285 domain-containing protein, partial [Listeria monocytogenes]|uniref:DUF285 domain-containing protein n=1 Tax=Listeria monocytogenes TaxID=1639 RepID=UPI001F09C62C